MLVPKCPVCIAVYLSAIGTGASTARGAAPLVVHAGNALVALALIVLGLRVVRARRYGLVALFAISAGALLALALAFPTPLWPRLIALAGVGVSVLRSRRVTHPAFAHVPLQASAMTAAPATESQSRQAGFTTRTSKRFVYHLLRRE
ncbi:hypothetical protein [Pyxidicoccus caerfyrddinensis]|uniref:hypothetical protein n=1 Tax=Pyxidicoccus caerfyrddinensis TaxID=2709663 RepID=UPI0013D91375|nr:hypothetical protein [Pyxidicoccus caerfyrddinensis]